PMDPIGKARPPPRDPPRAAGVGAAYRGPRSTGMTLTVPTLTDRASGLLLHPTSLPGPHGSGDLGQEARRFAGFLFDAGQRWWQMLPVGPVGYGNSPYSALSAFAGSPLLLDLDALASRFGTSRAGPELPEGRVDYARAQAWR